MALGGNSTGGMQGSGGGMAGGGGFGSPGGGRSGGNNGGASNSNSSSATGASKSSTTSAAGKTSTAASSKNDKGGMTGALSAGPTATSNQNAGANQQGGTAKASTSTSAAAGSVMGGLKSAVNNARAEKGLSRAGMQDAVNNAFGTSSHPNQGTTAPNATPSQKDAYRGGYRDQANAGITSAAFGSTAPGVGSLVGAGLSTAMTMGDKGMAPENAAAYSSGRTGAKDAGISSGMRVLGATLGGILGGPVGGMLANAALGIASYNMQRQANPEAFTGAAPSSTGPVGSTGINGVAGPGNNAGAGGNANAAAGTPTMASTLAYDSNEYGAPSDYSTAYNSYHAMNLGDLPNGKLR